MTPSELLTRLARTLRAEIGPAVESEYARTQAFLSAVVLEKLAGQIRLAAAHAAAEAREQAALARDLERLLVEHEAPPALRAAAAVLNEDDAAASLSRFIETLYASRDALGEARFGAVRARVRTTLRAGLDRRLAYAS